MPFYQRLGDVPRKRHIQFRDNGTLLTEEVMGLEGFVGNESILYHLQSPCRVMKLGGFETIERDEWVPDAHATGTSTPTASTSAATRSPGAASSCGTTTSRSLCAARSIRWITSSGT